MEMKPRRTTMERLRTRLGCAGLLVLIAIAGGCGTATREPGASGQMERSGETPRTAQQAATTSPADAASEPIAKLRTPSAGQVSVRLGGREVLQIRAAFGRLNHQPVTYMFSDPPAATQPEAGDEVVHTLRANSPADLKLTCRIVYDPPGDRVRIILSSEGPLPEVNLLTHTPEPMLPVRFHRSGKERIIHSVLGMTARGLMDGLYDARRDEALGVEGDVTYQPMENGTVILVALRPDGQTTRTVLTLTRHPRFLESTLGLPGEAGDRWPAGAATAGWTTCASTEPVNADAVIRDIVWAGANLARPGLRVVQTDAFSAALADAAALARLTVQPCPPPVEPDPDSPPASPSGPSITQQFERSVSTLFREYWAHGIIGRRELNPLWVGERLPLPQARLWASLAGLGGCGLMIADRLDVLPSERVEILARVLPPAPVRAVDLFEHGLPSLWSLKIAARFAQWDVLGVFNWSSQPVRQEVWLDRLHLDLDTHDQFAVYDVWEEYLVAVAQRRFEVDLEPRACRVLAIVPLQPHEPTLLGSNRHITCGALDLADVYYNRETATLHGRSEVTAHRPYELRIFLPQGEEELELNRVEADDLPVQVRRHGPIRCVVLHSAETRWVDWEISFRTAAVQSPWPGPPARLEARQTTRGVRLTWNATDDRAARYRIYRDGQSIGECDRPPFHDHRVRYDTTCVYRVSAVDWAGNESELSTELPYRAPVPASTNLTQLVPLSARQDAFALGTNQGVGGRPLRVAGRRYRLGLGTHANANIRYFLGEGYARFSGEVGIDDGTEGAGSAVFRILGDGRELFASEVKRGGERAGPFNVSVASVMVLELVVEDAGDGTEGDHANWGNPYLRAAPRRGTRPGPATRPASTRPGEQ